MNWFFYLGCQITEKDCEKNIYFMGKTNIFIVYFLVPQLLEDFPFLYSLF